jgi:hypothetical protein
MHTARANQFVTWGVHSDVGVGYATVPTSIINDALFRMSGQFDEHGLRLPVSGSLCPTCGPNQTHYPHTILTYIKHGGQTFAEIARPMVEYPMPSELGLGFFFDEMDFTRVGTSATEALVTRALWLPARLLQIHAISSVINLAPGIGGIASNIYRAWNIAALHASHIQYYLNRI